MILRNWVYDCVLTAFEITWTTLFLLVHLRLIFSYTSEVALPLLTASWMNFFSFYQPRRKSYASLVGTLPYNLVIALVPFVRVRAYLAHLSKHETSPQCIRINMNYRRDMIQLWVRKSNSDPLLAWFKLSSCACTLLTRHHPSHFAPMELKSSVTKLS